MRVQDLMETNVASIDARSPADRAWELMRIKRIRHLVVTKEGTVVGVLSERDLGGSRSDAIRRHRLVEDLMTRRAVTIRPDATIRQAANLMRGRSIGCLPVLQGRRLVGILTVTDLLESIGRGVERPVATSKRWTLKHRGHRPSQARAGPRSR